jgi:hypothetical protein
VSLHASQNNYRSPRRKSGECCCNGVQTAQLDFSERGRPWNYTRTYYSRVTSARGEKNKKRDHCQRSQLYGSSNPPTTNNNGNRAATAAAARSARGSMRERRDGPTRTKLRPVQRTRQQPQSARDGGDSKRTTQVLTEVLRIGKSPRMSPHMSNPPPIVRDIIMSYVPILGPESLAPPTSFVTSYGPPDYSAPHYETKCAGILFSRALSLLAPPLMFVTWNVTSHGPPDCSGPHYETRV